MDETKEKERKLESSRQEEIMPGSWQISCVLLSVGQFVRKIHVCTIVQCKNH